VENGPGPYYDAVGVDIIAKISHFRNRMSTCFGVNKPLWVTELAEHGYVNDPEWLNRQARYVIQGNVRSLAAGAEKIVWYALSTPGDPNGQALLFADLSPKPAFTAFKTLSTELRDYQYLATVNTPNVEGYVFSALAQANKTVAWGSGVVTLTPASQVRVVDRDGHVSTVDDGSISDLDLSINGTIQLRMTIEPIFIQVIH
jgi:hypothetical protein